MSNSSSALVVKDVTKVFSTRTRYPGKFFSARTDVLGLHNVNLRISTGDIVGLIGGNGSGKTTLLRVMSGALNATSGKVMSAYRPRLVSLSGLQLPNLSVLENTELMLRAHGRGKTESRSEALDLIELAELGDKTYLPYHTLSTGMRARLGFFLTTVNQPDILLMDELLSVADSKFHELAHEIITTMIASAKAVVIASHSMHTISTVCNSAVVMDRGMVAFHGTPSSAIAFYQSKAGARRTVMSS